MTRPPIVVMGVSGVGKSSVGRALAERLGRPFLEGDDFHPDANLRRMASGQPLTEADREPWLQRIAEAIAREERAGRSPIVACSALSRSSRSVLCARHPELVFVHLTAERGVIEARLRARSGHFMPASLLDSQLQTLEEPPDALRIDAADPVPAIVERIARALEDARGAGSQERGGCASGRPGGDRMQPLDNPVWSSLRSGHAHLALARGSALRYAADVAPFASVEREGEPVPDTLLAPDESICFVGVLPRLSADWRVEEQAHVLQLLCARPAPPTGSSSPWRVLGEKDVPAMLDLTGRVFPGYFRERTLEMGRYLGIFAGSRLVALAGERMNLGDLCEISAVCTDPASAGRGHARQLVHALVTAALQRGTTPFLHVSPENTRARRVYEGLGFELRATLRLLRVRRQASPPSTSARRPSG